MKRPLTLFLSVILSLASITAWSGLVGPDPISGVEIKTTLDVNETELKLQGAGQRNVDVSQKNILTRFASRAVTLPKIEAYVMQLFVQSPYTDPDNETRAEKIINNNEKMAVLMTITSNMVTRDDFMEKLDEGFDKSSEKNSINAEITAFKGGFPDKIELKDEYLVQFIPDTEVKLFKGEEKEPLVTIDTNILKFKQELVRIWLHKENPADPELRTNLLSNGLKTVEPITDGIEKVNLNADDTKL